MEQLREVRRVPGVEVAAPLAMFGVATSAQAAITTTMDPAAAPTGTHLLAGVGNADPVGILATTSTATVQCRNHGGQIVGVKSAVTTVTVNRTRPSTSRKAGESG